jgi:DinB superfamily
MHIRIHVAGSILSCCMLATFSTLTFSQNAAPPKPAVGTPVDPAKVYGKLLSQLEQEFVSAADAMPEDKYDFAPSASMGEYKGVRTFAQQVKHVTEANDYYFHDPSKPLVDFRGDIEKLKTKADILKALKDSFAMAHAYVDAITPENAFVTLPNGGTRAGQASLGMAHFMDHYGQLVEYLRMNGIVPPASRGAM